MDEYAGDIFTEKFVVQGQFSLEAVRCKLCGCLIMKTGISKVNGETTREIDDMKLHTVWHDKLDSAFGECL